MGQIRRILSSILKTKALPGAQGVAGQFAPIQVFSVHIHRRDLAVFIGGVIVNALVHIAAGGVDCDLVPAAAQVYTAPLLEDGPQNMEKLTDAFGFCGAGDRVELGKGGFDKA